MGNVVVGSLQVNVEANTATFVGDLGKASDAAEGFAGRTRGSMMESREAIRLVGEEVGVHLPRGLTNLISGIGPVGTAFSAMLPLAGVVAAVKILADLVQKQHETAEAAAHAWDGVDQAAASALGHVNQQLLRTDGELRTLTGDYLGALKDKLREIDAASLADLDAQLDKLAQSAVGAFDKMKVGWLQWALLAKQDWGSKEAAARLDDLKQKVDELTAKGDGKAVGQAIAQGLANAQGRLNDLVASQKTQFTPGTAQAVEAYQKLVGVLRDANEVQVKMSENATKQKDIAQIHFDDDSAKRATEAWEQQQRGLEKYERALDEYDKNRKKVAADAIQSAEDEAAEQLRASEAVQSILAKASQAEAEEAARHAEAMAKVDIAASRRILRCLIEK
jgi:hypothetical protein